jgi:GNAT superfamily N-acetyltransferase
LQGANARIDEEDVMIQSGTVAFRLAGPDDAESIARLHADSWRRHYRGAFSDAFLDGDVGRDRFEEWRERLSNPDGRTSTIVAEEDILLIGFVHLIFDEDARYGTLIDNLHVRHDRKRFGVGSQLMSHAAAAVSERAKGGLHLWVLDQNEEAQAFYRARGGMCTGRRLAEPPGGVADRLDGSPVVLRYSWTDPSRLAVVRSGSKTSQLRGRITR